MSDNDWDGALSELEARADVDSLPDLQKQRRDKIVANAKLIALHGAFGLFDVRRKQMLEAQKVVARMDLAKRGEKITDDRVESEAYGSTAYQNLLDEALDQKIEWVTLDNELTELAEKIKNRESALYVFGQEIKLAR